MIDPSEISGDQPKNQAPVLAIIQARMGSTRLPGKVLLDIAGKPMLVRVAERARRARLLDNVVIATSSHPADDPISALCEQYGFLYYRGSMHDVLDRYHAAAHAFDARVLIRLTADCPLIDPQIIDQTVQAFLGNYSTGITFDFACTRLPPPWHRTFPIGLDVEVCHLSALDRAWKESTEPYHREHVMPYFYEETRSVHYTITLRNANPENQVESSGSPQPVRLPGNIVPGLAERCNHQPFNVLVINHDPDEGRHRWTVDTPEDLEFIRQVFARFPGEDYFGWEEVLSLIASEPELELINTTAIAKDYRDVDRKYLQ
jgi:spore coat polysaccharide biosynthesis protein SpsF